MNGRRSGNLRVIHGQWSANLQQLLVWAEDQRLWPGSPSGRFEQAQAHPFAPNWNGLLSGLGRLGTEHQPPVTPNVRPSARLRAFLDRQGYWGLQSLDQREEDRHPAVVWLPSEQGRPLPSAQLSQALEEQLQLPERTVLSPWQVPALSVSPRYCLALTRGIEVSRANLQAAPSLRFFAYLAELTLKLIRSGALYPAARGWLLDERIVEQLTASLTAAIPPAVASQPPENDQLVGQVLQVFARQLTLESLGELNGELPDPQGFWTAALRGSYHLDLSEEKLKPQNAPQIIRALTHNRRFPQVGRVPGGELIDDWASHIGPQAQLIAELAPLTLDLSLPADAENSWPLQISSAREGSDPGSLGASLRGLGEVCGPLAQAAAVPVELSLSADQAVDLIEHRERLAAAGGELQIPAELEELTAPRSRAAIERPEETSSGLFSAEALCSYRYELAFDDQWLSEDEMQALVSSRAPLVRVRGRWRRMDRRVLSRAVELISQGEQQTNLFGAMRLAQGLSGQLEAADEAAGETGDETDSELAAELELVRARVPRELQALLDGQLTGEITSLVPPESFRGELRPYQAFGAGWIKFLEDRGFGAVLADDMGLGKAQPLDSPVLTPTGWVRMGEIEVGSEVIGSDGNPTKVVGVYPQGEMDVYRVTFSDGATASCTDDHLWQVNTPLRRSHGRPPRVLPLREIRQRLVDGAGNRQHFIPLVRPVRFGATEDGSRPLEPYLLGVLLGEGGMSRSAVHVSSADAEILDRVRELLPDEACLSRVKGSTYDWRITAGGRRPNPVRHALSSLGLMGHRSESKFIPESYKLSSPNDRLAVLQGLLDTDGWTDGTSLAQYSTSSPQLAQDVLFLVRSLGGVARINRKKTAKLDSYILTVALPDGMAPFRLSRKANAWRPRCKYPPTRAFAKVEWERRAQCQCIAVDAPDQLYVTEDFVVTHNTIQSLALLESERVSIPRPSRGPTLLVAPFSAVSNWEEETAFFTPEMRMHVHHGADRYSGPMLAGAVGEADMCLTSYHLLLRDIEDLSAIPWRRIAMDEIQEIKNDYTHVARAAHSLRAPRLLGLSGTPIENRLAELWSVMHMINRGLLGSRAEFQRQFVTPIEVHEDQRAAARLKTLVTPFILQRSKKDPQIRAQLPELPDKIEPPARACPLSSTQVALYQNVVDQMMDQIASAPPARRRGLVLKTITQLKLICNHPLAFAEDGGPIAGRSGKLAELERIARNVRAQGEKMLCFTQYPTFARRLCPYLADEMSCGVEMFDGQLSARARAELRRRFQAEDSELGILWISYRAGGRALNLTAANHVVPFDRWWNPAVEDQGIDRAYRIGQRRDVFVHRLITIGTIEEGIDNLIKRKRRLAGTVTPDSIIAEITAMSNQQLHELFSLSARALSESWGDEG